MNADWKDLAAYVVRLERERDELRVALESIVEDYEFCKAHDMYGDRALSYFETACAALSKTATTEPTK